MASFLTSIIPIGEVEAEKGASSSIEVEEEASYLNSIQVRKVGVEKEA